MSSYRFHPAAWAALSAGVLACSGSSGSNVVRVDGKLTQPVVSAFVESHPMAQVRLTTSGTGAGFQHFCLGRIDVATAGRPIRRSEIEECHDAGVTFIELPIVYDGIAVIANPGAAWLDHITVDELKAIWSPEAEGMVTRWSQIRASWPDRNLHLFGANQQAGSYDYFAAAVAGGDRIRSDYTSDADDDVLAQAVAQDELALGFVSLRYYARHRDRVKALGIDNGANDDGAGATTPTAENIRAGTYQPLARPMFIYVREQALNRAAVRDFVDFYLEQGGELLEQVGLVPLGEEAYELIAERRRARWTGTVFGEGGPQVGLTIPELLDKVRIN
jgi:phosphate transport system substrate-binding protein